MKPRSLLGMTLVLVVLVCGYYGMLRMEERHAVQIVQAKRMFTFDPAAVTRLSIMQFSEKPSTAIRTKDGWAMVEPNAQIEAADPLWTRLAKIVADISNERTIATNAPKETLEQYGLDKPDLTVKVETSTGEKVEMTVGVIEPTQLHRYALCKDSVFLITTKVFQELNRSLQDLRNRYAFTVPDKGITHLEFARFYRGKPVAESASSKPNTANLTAKPAGYEPKIGEESVAVILDKKEDGRWFITEPVNGLAKQDTVDTFVRTVQFAAGSKYIDSPEKLDDYGLNPPVARLTMRSGDGKPQTLLIGGLAHIEGNKADGTTPDKTQTGIYAKRTDLPSVFVIDAGLYDLFPKTPTDFREDRLLTQDIKNIKTLRYQDGQANILLKKDPEKGWKMEEPVASDVDQETVSIYISMLRDAQVSGFPDEAAQSKYGLDKPTLTLTMTFEGADQATQIKLGNDVKDTDQRYATQDNGTPVIIGKRVIDALPMSVAGFKSQTLLSINPEQLMQVSLELDGNSYIFEKLGRDWRIKSPPGFYLENQNDMALLLRSINPLIPTKMETEATPDDLSPYGLSTPVAKLVLIQPQNPDDPSRDKVAVSGVITIGTPAPDNAHERFVVCEGQPGVYRIKQRVMDGIREAMKGVKSR